MYSLEQDIARIKEQYLECPRCPPDRNCSANFHSDYGLDLEATTAETVFGTKPLESMLEKGDMLKTSYGYRFIGGRCPQLSEENLCIVHEKKKELGLYVCMQFPVYVVESIFRIRMPPLEGPLIIVDYRCFGIEENWDMLAEELKRLSEKHGIDVRVKYLLDENCRLLPLDKFITFRESGRVPPQKL